MSKFDETMKELVSNILNFGAWDEPQDVRAKWEDGSPAHSKSLINVGIAIDTSEVPILTTKRVPEKAPIHELLWIWQDKSNVVQDLRDRGTNIWDKWEIKEGKWAGTIGPAYGYQLGQKCRRINVKSEPIDQVDYLIYMLTNYPGSRRILTTLWDKDDLDEMALTPCVWSTQWIKKAGTVHLVVNIRSNDICVGNPFNVYQYFVLQQMMCQVTGNKVGSLSFNIVDAHIYDRHILTVRKQMEEPMLPAPKFWINPEIKNFYDFTVDDIRLIGYEHAGDYKYEVAE